MSFVPAESPETISSHYCAQFEHNGQTNSQVETVRGKTAQCSTITFNKKQDLGILFYFILDPVGSNAKGDKSFHPWGNKLGLSAAEVHQGLSSFSSRLHKTFYFISIKLIMTSVWNYNIKSSEKLKRKVVSICCISVVFTVQTDFSCSILHCSEMSLPEKYLAVLFVN